MNADLAGGDLPKRPSASARREWRRLLDSAGAGKRPRAVIDVILERGHCTTEDLAALGYEHPPRAARDVRELGIPLVTLRVRGNSGRIIAAYALPSSLPSAGGGRRAVPKRVKELLIQRDGLRCRVCGHAYEHQYLQVDHRVPYQVRPDSNKTAGDPERFMLLCGSCQRAKNWSCEHCPNWTRRIAATCLRCYWGSPGSYCHVATAPTRRLDVVWAGEECAVYDSALAVCEGGADELKVLLRDLLSAHVAT